MRYKKLGKTGLDISVLTIGNSAPVLTGKSFDDASMEASAQAILTMIENGANFIDTAAIYANGISELIVGKALKSVKRSDVIINTKFGCVPSDKEKRHVRDRTIDDSRERCFHDCEQSLTRMGTDYIDLFMPHHPSDQVSIEETMLAMKELQRQGKIHYIGLSNYSVDQIKEARKYAEISMIEMPYSMIDRFTQDDLKWAVDNGISTMVYGALGNGMLAGVYRELPKLDFYDTRLSYGYFSEPEFSKIMKLLETLDAIADRYGVPVSEVAINWTLQMPFVTTAILGTSSVNHAIRNCGALKWMLSESEMSEINKAVDATVGNGINFKIVKDSAK